GLLRLDERRSNEETNGVVAFAARDNLRIGRTLRLFDVAAQFFVGRAIDNRPHEVAEIGGISHGDAVDGADEVIFDPFPQCIRHIYSGSRAALLALIFVSAPNNRRTSPSGSALACATMKSFPPVSPTSLG